MCCNATRVPSLQYSVYCCILSLIACGVFLRVSFELKVLFLTVASVAYYIIILSSHGALFVAYGNILYAQINSTWNCSRWDGAWENTALRVCVSSLFSTILY